MTEHYTVRAVADRLYEIGYRQGVIDILNAMKSIRDNTPEESRLSEIEEKLDIFAQLYIVQPPAPASE